MTQHVSADDLTSLEVGELKPRKAAKVSAHIAMCAQCADLNAQLISMQTTLANTQYPPIPAAVTARIEAALAAEATHRFAAQPGTEASRGMLPARSQPSGPGRQLWGLRLPSLRLPAARMAAATAAAAVLAAGGYEVASNVGGAPVPAGASPAQAGKLSVGPAVTYGPPGAPRIIHEVRSHADFVKPKMTTEALAALHSAERDHVAPSTAPGPAALPRSTAAGTGVSRSSLEGCLNAVAPGRTILLVDVARYQNKPATIIVAGPAGADRGDVWAVGNTCSASNHQVLDHVRLPHL